jgi:hypothetical protein
MQSVEERFEIGNWSAPPTRSEQMRLTVFAATLAFLLWGSPAFAGTAPDFDTDGVGDTIDNCSEHPNSDQDDTDFDDCGNLCDADYDNSGTVGFLDFSAFSVAFQSNDEEKCHNETIPGCTVGFLDFSFFSGAFQGSAGPSGTATGPGAPNCP